jgi:hypothetical protein
LKHRDGIARIQASETRGSWSGRGYAAAKLRSRRKAIQHEYHWINDKIVWDAVQHELPGLSAEILQQNPQLREDLQRWPGCLTPAS